MVFHTAPALTVACAALFFGCVFACAYVLVNLLAVCRERHVLRHAAVAVTLVPVAFLLCTVLVVSYNALGETIRAFAEGHQRELPPPLVYAAAALRPLSPHYNLTETMWMACLLFVAYGVANVWHHLIDLTRLLKASRRRLMLPELREQRKNAAAAASGGGASAKGGRRR